MICAPRQTILLCVAALIINAAASEPEKISANVLMNKFAGMDFLGGKKSSLHKDAASFLNAGKVLRSMAEGSAGLTLASATGHSECIITESYTASRKFTSEVDAAAVYVNASTRFTDGGEFGFGAEIGISTQKLHARGPLGLPELTTFKYTVYGNGQVR